MAGRSRTREPEAVSEPQNSEDATVTTATVENSATAATEAVAEEVIDLAPFSAAVKGYLSSADATEAKAVYAGLSRKGKTAATKSLTSQQESFMAEDDFASAKSVFALGRELKATPAKSPSTPKAPKNPTEVFVARVATLQLAYNAAVTNVPAGTDENWQEQVSALAGAPTDVIKEAVDKLATRKLGTPKKDSDGPKRARHDVAKHLVEAFGSHPVGTEMDIPTIRSFDSAEYGEGNRPGAAAVAAHLKNAKFSIEGLEVVRNAEGKPTGVRKVA